MLGATYFLYAHLTVSFSNMQHTRLAAMNHQLSLVRFAGVIVDLFRQMLCDLFRFAAPSDARFAGLSSAITLTWWL